MTTILFIIITILIVVIFCINSYRKDYEGEYERFRERYAELCNLVDESGLKLEIIKYPKHKLVKKSKENSKYDWIFEL